MRPVLRSASGEIDCAPGSSCPQSNRFHDAPAVLPTRVGIKASLGIRPLVRECRVLTSRVGPGPGTMPRATRDCAELEGRVDHGLGDYGAGGPEAGPDRDGVSGRGW